MPNKNEAVRRSEGERGRRTPHEFRGYTAPESAGLCALCPHPREHPIHSPQPERPQPEGEDAREWHAYGEQIGSQCGLTTWTGPPLKLGERITVVPKSSLEAQRQRADEAEESYDWLKGRLNELKAESARERAGAKEMIEAMGRRLKVAEREAEGLRAECEGLSILLVQAREVLRRQHTTNPAWAGRRPEPIARGLADEIEQALTALNEKPEASE